MIRFIAFIILVAALMAATPAFAQTDEDESFQRETSYGINFNSNGGLIGGAFVRASFFMNERMYQFGGIEIVEVKHPKEERYLNYVGEPFVYGKKNYFFVVRPHYGRELVLFRKAAESGVQVNALGAIGPSIGLLVPYYIDYSYDGTTNDVRTVPYDEKVHVNSDYILGSDTVFRGLGQTKLRPGVHAKAGLSFEYGRYRESIAGIEVGVAVEYFPKEPVIIPLAENNNAFTSVYLNLYYGSRK